MADTARTMAETTAKVRKGARGRQQKWVAGGIYQPHPRQPYGRRPGSTRLIEDVLRAGYSYQARAVPPHIARRVALPMPRGGVRYLVLCPTCGERVCRLYRVPGTVVPGARYGCRVCLGLRYWSQYPGRRPEAGADRIEHLAERAEGTRSAARQRGRQKRVEAARQTCRERRERMAERQAVAFTLALLLLLTRQDPAWARDWLGQGKTAAGAAAEDATAPTAAMVAQTLAAGEPQQSEREDDRAKQAVQFAQMSIAEGLARYRDLGQPARRRRAA